MPQGLSWLRIVEIARRQEFYVHRYKWSHKNLRKKCRRLERQGILVYVGLHGDEFVYRASKGSAATDGRCERQFHGSCGELGFLGKGGTG